MDASHREPSRRLASAIALALLLAAGSATAGPSAGVAPGGPGQVADRVIADEGHERAILEWRSVQPENVGVGEAQVRSYRARAAWRLAGSAAGIASYAGFDLGLQLVRGTSSEVVRGPGVGVGNLDVGTAANAVLGFRLPLGSHASLYAEGRAGLGPDLGPAQSDRLRMEGRGDYSGFAGLHVAF